MYVKVFFSNVHVTEHFLLLSDWWFPIELMVVAPSCEIYLEC